VQKKNVLAPIINILATPGRATHFMYDEVEQLKKDELSKGRYNCITHTYMILDSINMSDERKGMVNMVSVSICLRLYVRALWVHGSVCARVVVLGRCLYTRSEYGQLVVVVVVVVVVVIA